MLKLHDDLLLYNSSAYNFRLVMPVDFIPETPQLLTLPLSLLRLGSILSVHRQ